MRNNHYFTLKCTLPYPCKCSSRLILSLNPKAMLSIGLGTFDLPKTKNSSGTFLYAAFYLLWQPLSRVPSAVALCSLLVLTSLTIHKLSYPRKLFSLKEPSVLSGRVPASVLGSLQVILSSPQLYMYLQAFLVIDLHLWAEKWGPLIHPETKCQLLSTPQFPLGALLYCYFTLGFHFL